MFLLLLPVLLLWMAPLSAATPSAFACPFTLMRPGMPMDPTMGEMCPSRSFLHYYACCEGNFYQCCFYFETWALVFMGLLGTALVIVAMLFAIRYSLKAQ